MKRFITYLYEYEHGQKGKNTGFVRVDERNGRVVFQISVRNFRLSQEKGEIYIFIWENELIGVPIGKFALVNNQIDIRIEQDANHLGDTDFGLECVVGMGFVFSNNEYMASCWDDVYVEVIGNGRFRKWGEGSDIRNAQEQQERELNLGMAEVKTQEKMREESIDDFVRKDVELQSVEVSSKRTPAYELITYQKMELNAIKNLPSPNWYLCNNRFLVHGFFNYGYLILKKTTEADGEKTYLGVPGVYEKPEMVMATLFGFPEFQTLSKEVWEAKMEEVIAVSRESMQEEGKSAVTRAEKREPRQGDFGCWLITIQG